MIILIIAKVLPPDYRSNGALGFYFGIPATKMPLIKNINRDADGCMYTFIFLDTILSQNTLTFKQQFHIMKRKNASFIKFFEI